MKRHELFFRSDIEVSVDVYVPFVNGTNGVFMGARVDQGGCTTFMARGIYYFLLYDEQRFIISTDLG